MANGQKAHCLRFDPQTPLRLVLILSRTLQNVTTLSGCNRTKPMSLKTQYACFLSPSVMSYSKSTLISITHWNSAEYVIQKCVWPGVTVSYGISLNNMNELELVSFWLQNCNRPLHTLLMTNCEIMSMRASLFKSASAFGTCVAAPTRKKGTGHVITSDK